MTRVSHEGGRAHDVPAIRRVRTGDSGVVMVGCDGRGGPIHFATSIPIVTLRADSPNQFYLARVIASDLLDQPDE